MCKAGDTVYEITERKKSGSWKPVIVPRIVERIEIGKRGGIGFKCGTTIWISADSDNVFLSLEEAEQALKEREK